MPSAEARGARWRGGALQFGQTQASGGHAGWHAPRISGLGRAEDRRGGTGAMNGGVGTLLAVLLTVVALRLGQGVLMPLAVAVLVSFLLAPVVTRVERV